MDSIHYPDTLAARAELCRSVILSAGELVLKGFEGEATRSFSMKGPQDFLTVTDAASEAHIRGAISAAFPDDSFFGEEGGGEIGERVWVVDPIDGTANFARGIPHFCISIAYVENGRTEIGAIYNPALGELYPHPPGRRCDPQWGADPDVGNGAFRCGFDRDGVVYPRRECHLSRCGQQAARYGRECPPRLPGALALAYVADGRSDGYLELHMNSWDCLAGLLLVSEAGGDVCPFLEIGSLRDGGPVLAAAAGVAKGVSQASNIVLAAR